MSTPEPGPAARPSRSRSGWPAAWVALAVASVPAAFGLFWLARDSGAAKPLCGDRPGIHYPACQLPPPWGTGAPPTTSGFTP